ncbi:MAG: DUF4157 domain-containing protein [Sphingomonadaceae bacterium]|nr:DUF4157 domain-containing protein [Sphingomonadaceae bacterium]
MSWRQLPNIAAIFAAGAVAGYLVASAFGAPLPGFVTAIRFDIHAAIDEARMRAALRHSQRMLSATAVTMQRGSTVAAATTLAEAIRFSRTQALKGRSRPLSDEMKRLYRPYFPGEMLEETRWTLAGRQLGLGSVLAGWYLREGAVTLDDVMVFSSRSAAHHEALMAHELTHVLQYRQLGVVDFARLYAQDWPLLEEQARRNAGRIIADVARREGAAAGARPSPGDR